MKNNLINKYFQPIFLMTHLLFFYSLPVWSQTKEPIDKPVTDPVAEMQVVIEDVLLQLKTNEALYKKDPEQLRSIVAKSALPNLYTKRMAQLALAKHWKIASAQQREVYVSEFQRYLIRSYTNILYLYRNTKPEIIENKKNKDNKTTLKVRVKNDRGETVILLLRLEFHDNTWKIVDVSAEGVSLVVIARGAFDEDINRIGLDAFLKKLTEQNNQAMLNKNE
jgi:phospholipid transport system substrate-binding protein